mgnify:CR=1 FL=1
MDLQLLKNRTALTAVIFIRQLHGFYYTCCRLLLQLPVCKNCRFAENVVGLREMIFTPAPGRCGVANFLRWTEREIRIIIKVTDAAGFAAGIF